VQRLPTLGYFDDEDFSKYGWHRALWIWWSVVLVQVDSNLQSVANESIENMALEQGLIEKLHLGHVKFSGN
jgi:hypothetical protein